MTTATKQNNKLERINPVNKRWELFLNQLYKNNDWNISKAYMQVYKVKNPETARANASELLTNPNFKEYHNKYIQEIRGINKENILSFFKDKLQNAKKEENSIRSAENLAKILGMYQEQSSQTPIQINVGIKNSRD